MTKLPGTGSFRDAIPAVETLGEAPREAHGLLPGPMAMPAAADAVGLDEDGEGVDTVMVVVTLTEDRPSSLLFRTALKCCGNEYAT